MAPSAEKEATRAFVEWVREEARLADEQAAPLVNGARRRRHGTSIRS
jgi:hypothetical protein